MADARSIALACATEATLWADIRARAQAVAHNIRCIEIGKQLGSQSITVWIGDGTNFPGQQSLSGMFSNYLDAMRDIYAALPADWSMFIEHKMYEPAFYSTVISDWGSSLIAAQSLGDKAKCLVDLGHHAPDHAALLELIEHPGDLFQRTQRRGDRLELATLGQVHHFTQLLQRTHV